MRSGSARLIFGALAFGPIWNEAPDLFQSKLGVGPLRVYLESHRNRDERHIQRLGSLAESIQPYINRLFATRNFPNEETSASQVSYAGPQSLL